MSRRLPTIRALGLGTSALASLIIVATPLSALAQTTTTPPSATAPASGASPYYQPFTAGTSSASSSTASSLPSSASMATAPVPDETVAAAVGAEPLAKAPTATSDSDELGCATSKDCPQEWRLTNPWDSGWDGWAIDTGGPGVLEVRR